ncbi:protein DGS1, mitochondrial-like [Oryza brachyantha]|uniref:protein DGS1, mitochondrial-like n=1 Tax=Oryza brachyantha TaxID=4533 RepID=UPI001AD9E5E9|nr:protein DGS1, mitochondrial-like [Oryza brachyantha]
MGISSPPPPRSPSSDGDPTEAAKLAVAALAVPARLWSSLVARLRSLPGRRRRRRGRRPAIPLLIRTAAAHPARVTGEMPEAFGILEDIAQHTLSSLHGIQKSLLFWQSKAEGTNSQKMYFMIFERGPRAFVKSTYQTLTRLRSNESPIQYLLHSASDMVSTKLAVLTSMQHCLAAFLAEIYCEVDKFREGLTENSDKSLHTLFVVLNTVFSKLEASLQNVREGRTLLVPPEGSSSEILFERLPEIDYESSEWTEASSTDAISLIYQNLQKLDNFVSSQLSSHKRPTHMTIHWLPYTCGALGLSACSLWLLRHSSLMGSPDIDNWIQGAKESVAGFWDVHVEKPIISIRGELFETFKNRGKHVMDKQEVQLNEEVLHRMMLAFCQETSNEKLPQDLSEQALMKIFMERYEKEWTHPVKNLFRGELVYAILIQLQKRTVDIKQALLELDQILKGNAINFAILAALPAFGVSLLLLTVVQAWVMNDQGAEGRGRIARRQRRLLLLDAERKLMEFKNCTINGMEEEACCKFGLTLYTLDRLYRAVESHAEETGEWSRLREDILDLAKPKMGMADKLVVLSRLKGTYDCFP